MKVSSIISSSFGTSLRLAQATFDQHLVFVVIQEAILTGHAPQFTFKYYMAVVWILYLC